MATLSGSSGKTCPVKPGDTVRLKDHKRLAQDCFALASGPDDPNARLAIDLYDWFRTEKPEVKVLSIQPDLDHWYLTVQSPAFDHGDEFGVRWQDIELMEAR
jgi:hypothetical protein